MKDTELAWAAGYFDGEGSTYVNRRKGVKHYGRENPSITTVTTPCMSVCQVDRRTLDRFVSAIESTRKIGGPYKPKTESSNPYFKWSLEGRPSVCATLTLLWPYLSDPKKEQARRVWSELEKAKTKRSPFLPPLPLDEPSLFTLPSRENLQWLGVDLDNTLAESSWYPGQAQPTVGKPIYENVEKLKKALAQDTNLRVVIHTARAWTEYELVEAWLTANNIPFKAIICGKLLAKSYIDDRAINASEETWI